jgi:hypothetical protein
MPHTPIPTMRARKTAKKKIPIIEAAPYTGIASIISEFPQVYQGLSV